MRARRLSLVFSLATAFGCGDGVGRPIVENEPATAAAAGFAGNTLAPMAGSAGLAATAGGAGLAETAGSAGLLEGAGGSATEAAGNGGSSGTAGGGSGEPGPDRNGGGGGMGGWGDRGEWAADEDWDEPDGMGELPRDSVPPGSHCESVAEWDGRADGAEQELLEFLNFARETGVPCDSDGAMPAQPLMMRPELRCAARLHSRDMYERDFFLHVNPDGVGPEDRMRRAGYSFGVASESIAQDEDMSGFMAPYAALTQLFDAGGSDCKNLVDPRFDAVGIGFFQGLWTLDFAGP